MRDKPLMLMPFELARRVRLFVGLDPGPASAGPSEGFNTFAGWPAPKGIGVHIEVEVRVRGDADPVTGYLLDIARIDLAVRKRALPILQRSIGEPGTAAQVVRELLPAIEAGLTKPVAEVVLHVSPFYRVSVRGDLDGMGGPGAERFIACQEFEFAAAHRLHCPDLSDDENRRIFGKCNNPSGHGHNYRIEVAVSGAFRPDGRPPFAALDVERVVHERIIRRFDHRHLNLDTEEFARLNPTVENIARTCYELLAAALAAVGGRLERITVWETTKTSCTYPAQCVEVPRGVGSRTQAAGAS